jgi:hypothetical protein
MVGRNPEQGRALVLAIEALEANRRSRRRRDGTGLVPASSMQGRNEVDWLGVSQRACERHSESQTDS